jgi:hypothetical protein
MMLDLRAEAEMTRLLQVLRQAEHILHVGRV